MKISPVILFSLLLVIPFAGFTQKKNETQKITFALGTDDFLLNGKPFQIRAGEIHPNRVPREHWRNRIQQAKAMGLNTIASYIFWNYHEPEEGKYDFTTWNRDLAEFFKIAQEEGMFVFLRPGPYCCAEYDFGAIPAYLLKFPDIRIRCMDPRYTGAAEKYITELAKVVKPYLFTEGGPIIMLQIENEYGSFANDKNYLNWLVELWHKNGIEIPFCTGDGPTTYMLEAGTLPGLAVGLDSGSELKHFELAKQMNPGVPVFSSETYPGWLTHWGEKWAEVGTADICKEVDFLMKNKKSFSLYVFHGGTNFGFTAGANSARVDGAKSGLNHSYMPDLTSYDYNAPITEEGRITEKYRELRKVIQQYLPENEMLPEIPEEVKVAVVPAFTPVKLTTLWDNLPAPVKMVQPQPMEYLDQKQGLILYRTKLIGHKSGQLILRELHDYALVFLDGHFVDTVDRRRNENMVMLPKTDSKEPVLDILVEAMGHINFAEFMIDRKGITDRVILNGMTLMNWEVYQFPLTESWVQDLRETKNDETRQGTFFKGSFEIGKPADTYLDMSGYSKGMVWVNGNNLGRYWEIGPQKRLYCPVSFLKPGKNEVIVFDLHKKEPAEITSAVSH